MTPPLVIPPYLKEYPLTGLIGMGGGATSRRVYTASSSEDYQISKSLRFNDDDSSYLRKKEAFTGNTKVWTLSYWVKRHNLGTWQWNFCQNQSGSTELIIGFRNDDTFGAQQNTDSVGRKTTAVFRDTSAWYNFVIRSNTPSPVADERLQIYCNGVRVDDTDGSGTISQDKSWPFNGAQNLDIGTYASGATYSDVSITDVYLIDGLALSPASFGSWDSAGNWNPKNPYNDDGEFVLPAPNANTTWSSGLTHTVAGSTGTFHSPAANAFNNDISSGVDDYQAVTQLASGNQEIILTWVPPTTVENVHHLRVSQYASNDNYISVRINSTGEWIRQHYLPGWSSGSDGIWMDYTELIPSDRTITKIEWKRPFTTTGDGINLGVIEVNGVALVDGVTDPTTRNNPNNGTTWSDYVTGTAYTNQGGDKAFDGLSSTLSQASNPGNASLTFKPPAAITGRVEILIAAGNHGGAVSGEFDLKIGNVSKFDNSIWPNNTSAWVDLGTQTIDTTHGLVWGNGTGNDWHAIKVIKIDGHMMLDTSHDNSFHLKFADASSNARLGRNSLNKGIDDSSVDGGLPIYNTTADSDGYDQGETKGSGYRTDSSAGTTDGTGLVFALPGDTLTDLHANINTGSSAVTLTTNGDPAVDTTYSRFYGSSIAFDGTGDYLSNSSSNSDFTMGTGDFTVECWVTKSSVTHAGFWQISSTAGGLNQSDYANTLAVGYYASGNAWQWYGGGGSGESSTYPIVANRWYHMAYVRSSSVSKLYINGKVVLTRSSDTNDYDGTYVSIGGYYNTSYLHNGNIQDFRIYKGVAKYTAEFTPPSRNDFTVTNLTAAAGTVQPQPILKTNDAGTSVTSGYSDDAGSSSLMLALHGSGSDGGTTFTDVSNVINSSSTTKSLSVTNGDPTTETDQSKFYGSSLYFDGDDELTISDTSELQFGTGQLTWEFWFRPSSNSDEKVASIGANQADANGIVVRHQPHSNGSNGELYMYWHGTGGNSLGDGHANNITNINAWNHFAITRDSGNEVRFFLNGKVFHTQNDQTNDFGSGDGKVVIGNGDTSWGSRYTGYIADMRIYKGYCKYTTDFTIPTTSISAENTDSGELYSANIDSLTDTPTNYGTNDSTGGSVRGNYCTFNSQDLNVRESSALSDGNLTSKSAYQGGGFSMAAGTLAFPSNDSDGFYFEFTNTNSKTTCIGLFDTAYGGVKALEQGYVVGHSSADSPGDVAGITYWQNKIYAFGANTGTEPTVTGGATIDAGSTVSCFVKDNKIWFAHNNNWAGIGGAADLDAGTNPCATLSETKWLTPLHQNHTGDSGSTADITAMNCGQRPWKYTPPTGAKSICTQNIDDTFSGDNVNDPSKYFDAKTWSGQDYEESDTRTFAGWGFGPDMLWVKSRDDVYSHSIWDQIRGNERIETDTNDGGVSTDSGGYVSALNSDGFTFTKGSSSSAYANQSWSGGRVTYSGWGWDAGTAASGANTNGTINIADGDQWVSSDAGFSITKFTGTGADATFGHGLSAKPEFLVIKKTTTTGGNGDWTAQHVGATLGSGRLILNENYANDTTNADTYWNSTAPTSTVISIGDHANTNTSGQPHICYAWTPVAGYSAFGSYRGNASADGPYVYLGFRPKMIIFKNTETTNGWRIMDTEVNTTNSLNTGQYPNTNDTQDSPANWTVDYLSNGFKVRDSNVELNAVNDVIIYMAWAENPFKTSRAR